MPFLRFVYGYPSSCPRAHCTPNKSVPPLRYTRKHIQAMPVGIYRVQSPGFPKIVYRFKQSLFTFMKIWKIKIIVWALNKLDRLLNVHCIYLSIYTDHKAYSGLHKCWSTLGEKQPSKHAGTDSHPGRIGWEALTRSGPDDCCTLACFRTGSVWPKPDTVSRNEIGSGLVLHNMTRAFFLKNGAEPDRGSRIWHTRFGLILASHWQ